MNMKKILLFLTILALWIPNSYSQNLSEGFEGTTFPPTGWTRLNLGDALTWYRSTSGFRTGVACARIDYSATAHNDWLITPKLAPASGNSTISFWAKNQSTSYVERFNVLLSTTGTNTADFTVTLASNVGPGTAYTQYNYDLSAYIGSNVYIAIQSISTDQYYLYLDDFSGPPLAVIACAQPTSLNASLITTNSATIAWTAPANAPANGYQWEVRTSGIGGSGATGLTASGSTAAGVTTANVTGLTAGQNYNLYVRSNCGTGFSDWAGPKAFTTLCNAITSFPYSEAFAGATIPQCWTQTYGGALTSDRWTVSTSTVAGGTANEMKASYASGTGVSRLILPPLNLLSLTTPRLSFKHFFDDYGPGCTIKVQSSSNGTTWVDESFVYTAGGGNLSGSVNVNITTKTANTFIAFVIDGDHYQFDYWYVDNVKVSNVQPIDIAFTSIQQTSGINPPPAAMATLPSGLIDKNDQKVPLFTILDPNASGTTTSENSHLELYPDASPESPKLLNAINLGIRVDNVGLNPSEYALNWSVGGVAQPPFAGAQLMPDAFGTATLTYTPSSRGTFIASGTLNVTGDGDLTNNSNQARVRVYPENFARTLYDNGTNLPNTNVGFNNPALQMISAVRFTAPNNFTKLQGVDFYCSTENITTGTFIVEVREPGATTTAPGAVFYTKQYTDPAYFAAGGDMIHFAFDDNFPSIAAGTDYWITITSPLGILFPGGAHSYNSSGRSFYSQPGSSTWSALTLSSVNYAWMMRSIHVVGNPLNPCPTPAKPTNLVLTAATTSISGTFTSSGSTGNVVVRSTSPTLSEVPQNGASYSAGQTLGNGTVVYAGTTTTSFTASSLTHTTQYYFFVFPYNSGFLCGSAYNTNAPLSGTATTLPAAPASFVASPLSPNQIGFTATANSLGHNIMIAYSTESSTAFGTPTTMYPIGSTIPGGGVVHYVGPANEVYNHNNLSENTTYYYRAWTIVPGPVYSSTSLLSTAKTPCSPFAQLPWNEGFENVDLGSSTSSTTLFPSCWTKQNGDWATSKNSNTSNDADARSGAQFLTNSWSANNEFMWTPGFALQSGMSYDFSFWWAGDNYAGWTGDVFYNSTPNGTGATQLGASFVTPATTTTKNYAKVTRTFAPTTDGTYYFAIRINATSAPWYLSFDDFNLRVTPTAPIFVITPQQADFGSQSIFSPSVPQAFTFYNDGIGTISISSIALGGTDANQFVLHTFQPMPIVLGPSQVATVSVTFAPGTAGPKTAQLVFTDNLSSKIVRSLPITGVGVDPTITSIPYIESFDGTTFAPIGWTNTKTAGTGSPGIWERTTAGLSPVTTPKSGAAMAQFRSFSFAAGTKAELITPPINLPAGNFRVSFWMNRDADYPTTADKVNVYYNTTNSITGATLLGTVHRSMSLEPVALTAGWYAYSFYLPENATGNGRYIILEGISAYGNNIFIDDFSISSPMVVSHTASNLSCFESNDGSIALNIQGGIPPLTITWKKDNELLESTSTLLEQLPAALYEYTVKEATGISVTELVTLTQPAAIPVATVTNTTVVYDGTAKTINAVAPAGTSLVWYTQAEGGSPVPAPAKIEAGTYNYWVAAKSNLTTCESQRTGVVLTINKKSLTVKADDKSKCQNADLPLLTITYTGFVPNEGPAQLTVLPVATTTALPSSPIGTYPITVGGGVSNNYSFVYQSGTLTVVRTPMVNAGGPGFVCVSEVFPIVAATATNYTSLVWSTSGNGTFSNANILNPVYTPGSLDIANGSATLTLTADPGSYCSDVDQMILSIQNDLPVSVTITQDDTEICLAEPVTFTAIPINGGLTPSFQWKVNGQNAGTNNSTFTYLPSDGDVVTVLHTTSISCALNNTALSNAITVDVTPDLTAGVSISTPSNAVCDFTPTTFNAIPSNGGVSPSYQWKVNGENMGTNAAEFTYIPINGDEVSVVMTSSHSCAVVPVAISNSIDMSVAPPFLELAANPTKGGTVSGGGNYADGTEVTITATAATGWEFLNWRDMSGTIVSTEAVTVHTIHECYEKLTATFSSTAKIVGQLKYFNEDETIIPSPNNHGVFYVQLFENGIAISPRQLVTHNLEVGLDSYYEFTGVESGKDYSVRIWEESTINTLANTWSWNNWGGATSSDAFIISWMANMNPELTYFPWIWPGGASELTPYSLELADVNNNQMIANSDALMVVYRLLGQPEFSPFPGGVQNFILATTKVADHQTKAHPNAPEKLFTQFGDYNASMPAPSVYQEVLLSNLSDGTNVYNIYFVATGDLNTSYTPGTVNRNLALLEYNGIINASKGDEILIPVRLGETADLGSITLGLNYNNKVIEVLDVIGYDLYSIDHANGTVKIAWYDMNSKVFANDQHLVLLQAKLTGDISAGTRYLELLPVTELADGNALQLQNVTLRTDYIETSSGIIDNPELLSISHSIYPNPFNGIATMRYTLPETGKFMLTIYNHLGQEITTVVEENQQAGAHELKINGTLFINSGRYYYHLKLDGVNNTYQARGTVVFTK